MSACFSAATGVFTLTPAGEKYLARCLSALAILGEAEDEISEQQTTLSGRQLTTQTSVLCAAPDYLAQAGTPADTGELMQHRCITGFRRDKPFYWSLYCDGQLLRIIPPPFYELADGDAMLAAVLGTACDGTQTPVHILRPQTAQLPVRTRCVTDALLAATQQGGVRLTGAADGVYRRLLPDFQPHRNKGCCRKGNSCPDDGVNEKITLFFI
ncbi:hypothetical protein [Morganella morganii]|uniref:hypothetical protein n=1 Tax=Morganella morganii TaxID=582 RepID=UPI001F0BFBBC|nr:hypothetical protein [Morganella morganii]